MADAQELKILLTAIDNASAELKKAQDAIKNMGKEADTTTTKSSTFASSLTAHSRQIGMAFTVMGGAVIGALTLMVKQFEDASSAIYNMSLRTGVAIEQVQRLGYAMKLTGGDISSLEWDIRRMQMNIGQAGDASEKTEAHINNLKAAIAGFSGNIRGNESLIASMNVELWNAQTAASETRTAFDKLGINLAALKAMKPDEQFIILAAAIATIPDKSERARVAVEIFGRTGTNILPLLENGIEGLNAAMAKAPIMSDEMVKAGEKLGQEFTHLQSVLQKTVMEIAVNLKPAIETVIPVIIEFAKEIGQWVKDNPGVVSALLQIAVALGGVALVIGPLIAALPLLAAAMSPIALIAIGIYAAVFLLVSVLELAKQAAEWLAGVFGTTLRAAIESLPDPIKALLTWLLNVLDVIDRLTAGIMGLLGITGKAAPIRGGSGPVNPSEEQPSRAGITPYGPSTSIIDVPWTPAAMTRSSMNITVVSVLNGREVGRSVSQVLGESYLQRRRMGG